MKRRNDTTSQISFNIKCNKNQLTIKAFCKNLTQSNENQSILS